MNSEKLTEFYEFYKVFINFLRVFQELCSSAKLIIFVRFRKSEEGGKARKSTYSETLKFRASFIKSLRSNDFLTLKVDS